MDFVEFQLGLFYFTTISIRGMAMNVIKKLGRVLKLHLSLLLILLIVGCGDTEVELELDYLVNPVPLGENWRMFINHVHTIYSEDNPEFQPVKSPVAYVINNANNMATALGTDAAIAITDHRTIEALFDPGFAPVGNAIPIIGEEWGGSGHANLIGFSGDTKIKNGDGVTDYEAMIAETHSRDGIVIVNHPGSWNSDRALGVDAIEVLNGPAWTDRNLVALAWWQRLLAAGEQVTVVGGTDSHFIFTPIQMPINFVYAESNSQEDMLDAVVSGHVMVIMTTASGRALLTADLNNDGVYDDDDDDAMMGDEFIVSTPKTVSFEVKLEGAPSQLQLKLFDRNGVFYVEQVRTGSGWNGSTYRFTRTFLPNEKNFVRAELVSLVGPVCLTNPIYAVGTDTSENTEASLQGVVTLAGVAIEGATIEIRPVDADPDRDIQEIKPGGDSLSVSSSDGSYSVILPHGAYTVTVIVPDSEPQLIESVVIDDGDVVLDIAL